ncbi:structural maintenance of chromosomes protein 1A [Contarinia nasturtii]|uniref:structural maintenance of chromosomes protein 1A n=1 Tax=Contarinia nasturtii TaxID=265458 RepID=UPI0012D4350E|nr:structural maintenance of chromosomes protein 1A [Contarinia nasturtii]
MFKKRPIATLVANINGSSIFRRSKNQNKNYIVEPEWDVQPVDNIIMSKVLSDRKNAEVIEQQERMREEVKDKGRRNKKRLKEIRKMQKELRQKFIETNDFINECEHKEAEADKKIAAEVKLQNKLKNDIDDYEERIRKLTEYHEDELKPAIKELSVYENVLQEVVDDMDLFDSKEDFLDRVEALLLAQDEVSENDSVCLEKIEKMQGDIVKTSNEATLMIAGLENRLIELEKNYENVKSECLKFENVLHPAKEIITEKEKEMFMLLDQIQQMYLLLCARNCEEPKFKREQIDEQLAGQLDYIKREIEMILETIDLAREMEALEMRSDIASYGSGKSGKPRK